MKFVQFSKKQQIEAYKKKEEETYVDVVADGVDLLVGLLVEPVGADLVEYLIHFSFPELDQDQNQATAISNNKQAGISLSLHLNRIWWLLLFSDSISLLR